MLLTILMTIKKCSSPDTSQISPGTRSRALILCTVRLFFRMTLAISGSYSFNASIALSAFRSCAWNTTTQPSTSSSRSKKQTGLQLDRLTASGVQIKVTKLVRYETVTLRNRRRHTMSWYKTTPKMPDLDEFDIMCETTDVLQWSSRGSRLVWLEGKTGVTAVAYGGGSCGPLVVWI